MENNTTVPYDMDQLLEEAIPLIAQDLRSARIGLGITSARAAKRAGVSWNRYRQFETGKVHRRKESVVAMISAADSLGLETVRMSYVDFLDEYLQVGVAHDEPPTMFIDALDSNIAELKEQGHFVCPHLVLDFVDREGIGPIVDSRTPVDKMMVELWVTAIYTLCLNRECDYYVRLTRDDPPDTEVLIDNSENNTISMMRVEITQHGRHSTDLIDVIGKKLRKRYQDGTVLLVFIEEEQSVSITDLCDYIWKNNPHRQEIIIIGGAGGAGKFKIVPWEEVTAPSPDEMTWLEIIVDTNDRSKARCKYDGVVFKPPFTSRFRRLFPVFVKSVALHR